LPAPRIAGAKIAQAHATILAAKARARLIKITSRCCLSVRLDLVTIIFSL
jgi:hypothetical protein